MKRAILLVGIVCVTAPILAAAEETSEANWQTFIDGTYKVLLRCPANWKPHKCCALGAAMGPENAIRGFGFGAEGGPKNTAQQLCKAEADHVLRPFGNNPTIRLMKIQGQSACLIYPSKDLMGDNEAELFVKYPEPVKIDGAAYSFLALDADKNYITALMHSLRLLQQGSRNVPFLMELSFESGADSIELKVGAPVIVNVTLKNNSDRILRVPFFDPLFDYRFSVSTIRHGPVPVTGDYQRLEREHKTAPPARDPVAIKPHSVYQTKVDVSALYQLPSAGTYSIQGQIKLPAELGPGLVNSNRVTVAIAASAAN